MSFFLWKADGERLQVIWEEVASFFFLRVFLEQLNCYLCSVEAPIISKKISQNSTTEFYGVSPLHLCVQTCLPQCWIFWCVPSYPLYLMVHTSETAIKMNTQNLFASHIFDMGVYGTSGFHQSCDWSHPVIFFRMQQVSPIFFPGNRPWLHTIECIYRIRLLSVL